MKKEQALAKLDAVVSKSKVEMYKPIQVAEVLHAARNDSSIKLDELETYRTRSKKFRDQVTRELFGKVSTSSAKFQDDIWSEDELPPPAMQILGNINATTGKVEEYIYQNVWRKNSFLIEIRNYLQAIEDSDDLVSIFEAFEADGMRSSGDRFFETFCVAVLQCDVSSSGAYIKILEQTRSNNLSTVEKIIDAIKAGEPKLQFSRIGHTNAADAGLDIWSNFGVIVSVKNYLLDADLAIKVLEDTPVGELIIACDNYTNEALEEIKKMTPNRSVTIVTKAELLNDAKRLLSDAASAKQFVQILLSNFDHEFPMALTLESFMKNRGYSVSLPSRSGF
jgi:HaeII restriction endonuclease